MNELIHSWTDGLWKKWVSYHDGGSIIEASLAISQETLTIRYPAQPLDSAESSHQQEGLHQGWSLDTGLSSLPNYKKYRSFLYK